jgi:transmembrane sensor
VSEADALSARARAEEIEARAAEWLVKKRAHETWSAEDEAAFDAWLAESWAHATAYWRLSAAWDCTDRIGTLRRPRLRKDRAPERRNWRSVLRIAAVLVAAVSLAAVGTGYFAGPHEKAYATGLGGREVVTLTDGTRIELNTNTVLRVATGTQDRAVTLEKGEAYFDVVHNAAHPFTVLSEGHRITDLGTKFVVKSDPGRLKVSLVEGLARIEFADEPVKSKGNLLKPGDVAIATADSISVSSAPPRKLKDELAWRRGVLIFRDTTLAEAVAEFNRYNSEKIVIADAEAARRRIGGTFTTGGVERFAEVARIALGLDVRTRQHEIFISTHTE